MQHTHTTQRSVWMFAPPALCLCRRWRSLVVSGPTCSGIRPEPCHGVASESVTVVGSLRSGVSGCHSDCSRRPTLAKSKSRRRRSAMFPSAVTLTRDTMKRSLRHQTGKLSASSHSSPRWRARGRHGCTGNTDARRTRRLRSRRGTDPSAPLCIL